MIYYCFLPCKGKEIICKKQGDIKKKLRRTK